MLKKQFSAEYKALGAEDGRAPGEFEAVVAVFDNVDAHGDRVKSGAFDETLEAWRKSGDPIPIILAHQWDDPWKHIGYAMPEDVKSIPGRGLYVSKGILDVDDNPLARQVYRLMERRTLKEFSFGYTVGEGGERKAQDGAYDLTKLGLIEFGPCLKGVNDSTELLAVKAELDAERRRETGEEPTIVERLTRLEAVVEGKAYAELAGTFEARQDAVREALQAQYATEGSEDEEGTYVYIEGTKDSTVVFCVHGPEGRKTYQADYEINDEGAVTVGEAAEVEVVAVVEEKAEPEAETKAEDEPVVDAEAELVHGGDINPNADEVETKAAEAEVTPIDTIEQAKVKSAEMERELYEVGIEKFERELGLLPGEHAEAPEPVETKAATETLDEIEEELREPVPFDIGEVRRKAAEDMLDTTEAAHRDVYAVDQDVDNAARKIEELSRGL